MPNSDVLVRIHDRLRTNPLMARLAPATQVVVIHHGEIVERGTHQSLLDKRGFYHHLYVSRFKGQAI